MGVLGVVAIVSNFIDLYLDNLAARTQNVIDVKLFPLLRRISVVIIYGLGGLLVMDLLDLNISPLIAGLGLGGLAVAGASVHPGQPVRGHLRDDQGRSRSRRVHRLGWRARRVCGGGGMAEYADSHLAK